MEIYLDHASTTPIKKEVFEAMEPYLKTQFHNPSSLYDGGIRNKKVINSGKKTIARLLNCDKKEIYFTSGGSEANNWALKGLAYKYPHKKEIIMTKVEHHSILNACAFLESQGFIIHYLEVNEEGMIDIHQLEKLMNDQTLVVSIMFANNEIGTIQSMKQISQLCRQHQTYLHTDAVQALCHISIDLTDLDVDLMSFSAHKFHGPKGIGGLYIKSGVELENLIHGGQQEQGKRSGTENVPYIVGMAKAMELGISNLTRYRECLNELTTYFYNNLKDLIPTIRLNGPCIAKRLPGNLNVSFKETDGSVMSYLLNKEGIYVSTGSACDSQTIEPSHVLQAIHVPIEYIHGSIRFSLGDETTKDELDSVIHTLYKIINQ